MSRILFFLLLIAHLAQASTEEEVLLHKEFIPTAFGIKSRTIDIKDAEAVLRAVEKFKIQNPKVAINKVSVLTCTSDYRLPSSSPSARLVLEHIELAKQRQEMLQNHIPKVTKLTMEGEHKVCGPEFQITDLNHRFVTKESGEVFQQLFKKLTDDADFVERLKKEALEEPQNLIAKYPNPFLAKYKPFQGIRLFIFGKRPQNSDSGNPKQPQPSGKNQ